jgi:hypothetical protein
VRDGGVAEAYFLEIWRCAGVDHRATPPGMMVPFGGSNQIVLETSGMELTVKSNHVGIVLEEFDGKGISTQLQDLNVALYQPDIDPLFREAFMPVAYGLYKPRYFRIHGKALVGSPGASVKATPVPVPGRKAPSIGASLDVICVDTMTIKVAIRNVQCRDDQGAVRYHARLPCDPKAEVANMNAVWTPQANIKFELVPSTDLLIDHDDPATREELRQGYGQKDTSASTFKPLTNVPVEKLWDLFAKRRVPGAHITFFLVQSILSGESIATGTMNSTLGAAFIAGTHFPTTFAHEAGHYLGRTLVNGVWTGEAHKDASESRMLMKRGGSSWAVPFDMMKRVRAFTGKPF